MSVPPTTVFKGLRPNPHLQRTVQRCARGLHDGGAICSTEVTISRDHRLQPRGQGIAVHLAVRLSSGAALVVITRCPTTSALDANPAKAVRDAFALVDLQLATCSTTPQSAAN
ncbi:MAG: hypothetical protein ACOCYV_02145 [Planctomycetota bacterium]